jgi:hypothetical protein
MALVELFCLVNYFRRDGIKLVEEDHIGKLDLIGKSTILRIYHMRAVTHRSLMLHTFSSPTHLLNPSGN